MSFIEAEDLGKTYDTNGIKFTALHGVNFMLEEGSLTVILGPSGAGKTTLLNLIGGMDAVTAGRLTVGGKHLEGMNRKELTLYRRADIGFVFQFYNLMPNLIARENIELATEICPDAIDPVKAAEMVGLEEFQDHFPGQLSGGQQQRVSIARTVFLYFIFKELGFGGLGEMHAVTYITAFAISELFVFLVVLLTRHHVKQGESL